jgi:hypothetical protein
MAGGSGPRAKAAFRANDRHGGLQKKALHKDSIGLIVKHAAARIGLDSANYAGHSLRAGLATQAYLNGTNELSSCSRPATARLPPSANTSAPAPPLPRQPSRQTGALTVCAWSKKRAASRSRELVQLRPGGRAVHRRGRPSRFRDARGTTAYRRAIRCSALPMRCWSESNALTIYPRIRSKISLDHSRPHVGV